MGDGGRGEGGPGEHWRSFSPSSLMGGDAGEDIRRGEDRRGGGRTDAEAKGAGEAKAGEGGKAGDGRTPTTREGEMKGR